MANWNAVVKPTDTVWHLGDFAGEGVAFDHVASVFKKLSGRKRLIAGNHEGEEVRAKLPWESVDEVRTIVAPGCKVVLCHYPFREWNGYYSGDLHFHGHTHGKLPSSRRSWDCGIDHKGFAPMTFQAIRAMMVELDELDFTGVLAT